MGPFIDEAHPLIQKGQVSETVDKLFEIHIASNIIEFLKDCPFTQIVLVPHIREMIHPWLIYPQPPLDRDLLFKLGKQKEILEVTIIFIGRELFVYQILVFLLSMKSQSL